MRSQKVSHSSDFSSLLLAGSARGAGAAAGARTACGLAGAGLAGRAALDTGATACSGTVRNTGAGEGLPPSSSRR
ncbi:hypothetical protein ACP3WC_24330, partial [Salmonella enterica]|uniref:hypothetical protein n=1 Tax=Salmonella enterica TaxID=28901 RepID=UPI003CF719D1